MGLHKQHSNTQMALLSDQQSSNPTPTNPDLHQTPNYSNHAHTYNYPPLLNQAQEMAILEQIWNDLSLGRSKPTCMARTTTTVQSLSHAPDSCLSVPLGAPLSSPNWVLKSSSSQVKEYSGKFLQQGLLRTTSRSHFPIS